MGQNEMSKCKVYLVRKRVEEGEVSVVKGKKRDSVVHVVKWRKVEEMKSCIIIIIIMRWEVNKV